MKILDDLGITPNNIKLYERAFSHTSYANEHHVESYERLEYLVADVFESFVGALYLDQGIEAAKKFIYKIVIPKIENKKIEFTDYKSVLQELVQTDKRSLEYVVVDESGPSHDKTFKVVVKIDNIIYGTGVAHSKKEAEQQAAKDALKKAQNGY